MTFPKQDLPIEGKCRFCHRNPEIGETYGPELGQWDFMNICPDCWDKVTKEPEDDNY